MKKEFEPNQNIEIELKLPAPFSAEKMKNILNNNFGIGSEKTYERTVMYDNSVVLLPVQHEFTFSRGNEFDTIVIPNQKIYLEVNDIEQLIKTFEAIGFKVLFSEDKIIFSLDGEIPTDIMTKVQDSRLRLRVKRNNQGESAEISYKRPLQRTGIKREIEYETVVGNFGDAETLLSILGGSMSNPFVHF